MKSQDTLLLGQVTSLLLTSEFHRNKKTNYIRRLIVPAIESGQIILDKQDDDVLGFTTWLLLPLDKHLAYLRREYPLEQNDFTNKEGAFWCIDMVAPLGIKQVAYLARQTRSKAEEVCGPGVRGFWPRSHRNHIGTARAV